MQNQSKPSISSSTSCQEYPSCPIDCPNRQSSSTKPHIVGGGYLFALIVALFLGFQSLDASYQRVNGEEDFLFATKSPPSTLLIVGLTLIGLGLGIEIDKSIISSTAKGAMKSLIHISQEQEN